VTVSDNESLCVFDTAIGQVRKMRPADAVGSLIPYVKLEALGAVPPKDDIDIVPISKAIATALMPAALVADKSLYATLSQAKTKGRVSRYSAVKAVALGPIDHPHWAGFAATVAGSDIHWEEVTEVVAAGKRDVFDLEVPSTKVFAIANGLVVWDTMQFHVPLTDEAVKEAYDRMLPSKSLISPADFKSPVATTGQQYQAGLYHATRDHSENKKRPRIFRNKADAQAARARGEISVDTPVEIVE
jgi:hypothetical protein